jgi:signal transduction histidine kinase
VLQSGGSTTSLEEPTDRPAVLLGERGLVGEDFTDMRRHRLPTSWLRTLWPLWHGTAGFLFGIVVLHSVAVVIFRWFDPQLAHGMHDVVPVSLVAPILHSFHVDMALFGFFSAAIALINGYYRSRLALQRDRLAQQAELLSEKNERLVKLEQANRRHTQFMVHDFKGHLGTILGTAEQLLEEKQKEPTCPPVEVEALTRIRRQARRMAGAVMDLLEFARLQESPTLRRERTPVSKLLKTAAADLSLPAQVGQAEVGPDERNCPDVTVDGRIIERVLVNLALNALKHNKPGTRVVIDACAPWEAGEVRFTCADDGRGLSSAAVASLFKEFGTRDETDQEDSTHLGLAFCKAAVEAHGGRIWCESSEGRGACFTFTVPLEQRSDQCQ